MQASSAVISSAFRSQTVKYVTAASVMSYVYDYFMTLDMEVEYIWKTPLHIGEILFYISRYSPLVDLPTALYYVTGTHIPDKTCNHLYYISSWATLTGIGASEGIMVLRTWALWGNKRPLLILLLALFLAISILEVTFLTLFLHSLQCDASMSLLISVLISIRNSRTSTSANHHWLLPSGRKYYYFRRLCLYETIVIILTLWIGVKRFRQSSNPLVKVLYRDGAFYFIWIFVISAGNIIVLFAGPPEYADLLNTFQRVMHSILSTRTILHVRSIGAERSRLQSSIAVSRLRFGSESESGTLLAQ